MVTIGNGRDDPRQWVKAAYLLIDAIENDPDGKPPSRSEVAAKLGIHQATVGRAYRELRTLGIIRHVPGHGILRGREVSDGPQDDAGLVVITITLPEGTDARVRVTSTIISWASPTTPSTNQRRRSGSPL